MRATDQGVSGTEILVALPYISLGGEAGNSTFNLRSPSDIEAIADAIVAGINAQASVACRKLRIEKYAVNPLSPVDQQQTCQRIISAKVFAVADFGAFLSPASRQCFVDAQVPYQSGGVNLTEARINAAYPYMYSVGSSLDRAARNWVFEMSSRGAFDTGKGFRKLGLLLESCNPDINGQLVADLRKVGVTDEEMSVFTLSGCSGINPPSEMSAAVAQHRSAGVSHVFLAGNAANSPQYVRQADSIRWKPMYMTSDVGQETVPTVAKNFPDGFDGAIAVTSLRTGERHSGISPTWVTRCNDWLRKADPRLTSQDEADQDPMRICDILRLFAFAANGAGPNLGRKTLVAGLSAGGRFEGALSTTINEYQSRKLWAGDFIRAIQWHVDCKCWRVIDRDLKAGH